MTGPAATVRAWGEGDRRWFLNTWSTIAVSAETTGGSMDIVTQSLPAGYCPPRHRHAARDEVLIVVRGEVELTCRADRWILGPGAVALVPRGATHALMVGLAGPADVVILSSPAGLGDLVADVGETPDPAALPAPTAPDLAALALVGARYDLVLDEDG